MSEAVERAVARIRGWGEARDWRGYDPYDALTSPLAPLLSLGTPLGRRLVTQVVKLSPVNLRPVIGVRPAWNAKAVALVASGYARLSAARHDEPARAQSQRWLEWLVRHHGGDEAGLAWGYDFDVQTRFFRYPRGTPNAIATSFAAQALIDGWELLDEDRWAQFAGKAAHHLRDRMLIRDRGSAYFRYVATEPALVHNANALGCAVLVRAAAATGEAELLEPAADALQTTLRAQRADGSWPYAEGGGGSWVDNFHTGYVLESLAVCDRALPGVRQALRRGLDYWERMLFLDDGTPKYFSHRLWPIDAHCYAQGVETWLAVAPWHPPALARATRLAELLVARMLAPSGYVHFQRRRLWTSRVPFVRWTTAPAFRALAGLLLAVQAGGAPPRARKGEHARLD
jgi:hypothetical protein